MPLLTRVARHVVPTEWRDTVEHDLVDEASRLQIRGLRADLWVAWHAVRIGVAFRWQGREGTNDHGRMLAATHIVLRDAWRGLRSGFGSTAFALLILTSAIAAATVTFSVVDAVVLRSLPFEDSDRIVMFGADDSQTYSAPLFMAWRDRADAFAAVAAVVAGPTVQVPSESGGTTDVRGTWQTTSSLFEVLQVHPVHGRLFTTENEVAGSNAVALIGYGLWKRSFGGDPRVIGRSIPMRNSLVEIIGVMPEGFTYPLGSTRQVWMPHVAAPSSGANVAYLRVIGRLRDRVSLRQAATQAATIQASVAASHGLMLRGDSRPVLVSLYDTLLGDVKGSMLLVLLAAALLMVVACVNVANLTLLRSAERARELAVRASFGASPRQLGVGLLTESLLLSLAAAVGGVVLASWGVGVATAALPAGLFRADDIAINARVLTVMVSAAVAAGVFFGVVPAWHAARTRPGSLLSSGPPMVTSGHRHWRDGFVVAEVAVVGALLVVSTMFVASFARVVHADMGFARSDLLAFGIEGHKGTTMPIVEALRATPGVASVAEMAGSPPLVVSAYAGSHAIVRRRLARTGDSTNSGGSIEPTMYWVSSDYFATARTPILRGRAFTEADALADVTIIDEHTASFLFGEGQDPVGAVLPGSSNSPPLQVIGVARAVNTDGPEAGPGAQMYLPKATGSGGTSHFLVRTSRRVSDVIPAIQSSLQTVLPAGAAVPPIRSLEDAFRTMTAGRRANATVMSMFGLVVLLIGAAGVYAVMASAVAQQRRDLGVRIALGATRERILRGVLARAVGSVGLGLVLGLAAGRGLSGLFTSLLFEVRPTDVSTYAIVAGLLLTVGLMAAFIPALRAARVDPIVTLRSE